MNFIQVVASWPSNQNPTLKHDGLNRRSQPSVGFRKWPFLNEKNNNRISLSSRIAMEGFWFEVHPIAPFSTELLVTEE